MVLLENEVFLTELTRMFQRARNSGAVVMVMKRYDGRTKPHPAKGKKPLPEPTEFMCLMRATLKNKKISTVIHPKDVNKFQQAYCNLLRGNLDGLKKLKKTKTKAKATQ
ncbi:signal recognition particle 14 kDa protein [Schistocerca americana]|uniref:signal recognition particle 14 kDa protein n=1 Tax=Schistocerca americana TaxID=7009 RepID=UPI001F4F3FA7|nr:signal recognition particle 14 kDa protein [Schistocerca americana]XP_047116198.1 signal recognition particle 14 kDa protein [Schistocerca piceifrons]XP_049776713.1 signal recognition particle 14 kDa protein [Schistocerca cancellata]XP_049790586.1 signal recognition particle 14 kDa protein [Schistocerca nitens]XP_049857648.1 signal recognition particle 14 kDa protein [Schistocerca gregaria]XP_049952351.1 signal recognition particle 14 kDa protein [Schistocerca serialis cubense]